MFGLGTWEIALILVVALLVLGPDRLPQLARTLGKALREMRRASNDLRMSLEVDDPPPRPRPVTVPPGVDPYLAVADAAKPEIAATDTGAETASDAAGPAEVVSSKPQPLPAQPGPKPEGGEPS